MTLLIFRASGKMPVENDVEIILLKGTRIKSGISLRSLTGILCGPVDLFSKLEIISSISSLDV